MTVDPLTEQTEGVVDARVTGSPEVAVAETEAVAPGATLDGVLREMLWVDFPTVILWVT